MLTLSFIFHEDCLQVTELWFLTGKVDICAPKPANEALCGKVNFALRAKMLSKVTISQILKYA